MVIKRWSLDYWNDWRYVRRGFIDVTLLRINADYLRNLYACADVVVLGFGVSLTCYFKPEFAVPTESLGRAE